MTRMTPKPYRIPTLPHPLIQSKVESGYFRARCTQDAYLAGSILLELAKAPIKNTRDSNTELKHPSVVLEFIGRMLTRENHLERLNLEHVWWLLSAKEDQINHFVGTGVSNPLSFYYRGSNDKFHLYMINGCDLACSPPAPKLLSRLMDAVCS